MNWNEVLQWSRMAFIACLALVVQMSLSLAVILMPQRSAAHRIPHRVPAADRPGAPNLHPIEIQPQVPASR